MNKKAIELSVNFLVILILSIVIFSSALILTKKVFDSTTTKQKELDDKTIKQIEVLLNDGSRVGIPILKKSGSPGDQLIYGLGIYNVLRAQKTFHVEITFKTAYAPDDTEIVGADNAHIESDWYFSSVKEYTIKNNEYVSIPILFEIGSEMAPGVPTQKGIYIFDVKVTVDDNDDHVNTGDKLYDGNLHKIYVVVE
ncbi:hypothetical protein H6504_04965 [Candidatus Woesearchaeota archaeon]|nr:hypothetical protein [Candidatus Woesearchaeota archaeon]